MHMLQRKNAYSNCTHARTELLGLTHRTLESGLLPNSPRGELTTELVFPGPEGARNLRCTPPPLANPVATAQRGS